MPLDKQLIPYTIDETYGSIQDVNPEGIQMIHAPRVWDESKQGEDIVVAVIDTGIDKDHPDLEDRIIDGKDFTDTGDFDDDNGHGTHVSGTILASLDGQGVVGVAPKSQVLALKALNAQGAGTIEQINNALEYAINWEGQNGEKVNIISMSLGGQPNDQEHQLIKEAVQNEILVVCAAGNSGDGNPDTPERAYPGAYEEVVEVGAVNFSREIADFSNTNKEIDLVAPGVGIISTYIGGRYAKLSGTSMATPHVSGSAALIRNLTGVKTERKLFAQLVRHAKDLGFDPMAQGNGLVDLTAAQSPEEPNDPDQETVKVTVEVNGETKEKTFKF